MRRGLKTIGEVMGRSEGRNIGIARTIAMANVATAWEEHMRDKFGCASSVSSISEGVLHIAVEESVWAQQMSMLKKHILQSLAEHCDISGVKDIRFSSFGSTERHSVARKPKTGSKSWPSSADLKKENIPTDPGSGSRLNAGMPEVLKRAHSMQMKTEAVLSRSPSSCCEVCNIQIPRGSAYCPICALKPYPQKASEAVHFLLESPYAADGDIAEICCLDGLGPQEAFEIIRFSRDVAGRRLIEEALCEAKSGDGGESRRNKARMLLIGSACASTGVAPDVIIARGLKAYFIPAILDAAGQNANQLEEQES